VALKGLAMVAAGGASGPGEVIARACGTPLDQVHIGRAPERPRRVAAVA
jgi:hypothetical protein